ncbi:MAG: MATE family efflux transporter [Candidatus Aminicenantes bacterium]|nr:MATE family efflux transporter [Candidatus Aminicenantes bacterium]
MNREILRLAIPNILSNISIPLLGMVDTALMGRLESEIYIGAVALGSILFNFIYWGFGFLRMGTTGLTAQAFGREDDKECASILGRGLLVALWSSIIIIALQYAIAWIGFTLLQGEPTVEAIAREYFMIRIYAAPATLGLYAFHGWFLGMQNARYPMGLTIFVNGMNILFNIFFVFQLGMKSDGVALGTVCAQYLGLALAAGMFFTRYRYFFHLLERRRILQLAAMKHFFAVNGDIFIRTISLVFVFAFFTSASAAQGSLILAANQILYQYMSFMAYAVDGFAYAAESLVGRFMGAKDLLRLKRIVRLLFIWGCGFGAVFAAAYGLFGRALLRIFTDQPNIILAAVPYFWWTALVTLAGAIAFMWDGVYIGATATVPMRNMMLLATIGVFLPSYYLFISPLGNHGLWLAMTLFMAARGLTLGILAKQSIFTPCKA